MESGRGTVLPTPGKVDARSLPTDWRRCRARFGLRCTAGLQWHPICSISPPDLLAECQSALARQRAGTFGLCARCCETISGGRLEAFAHARYCVGCAREAENDEQD